MVDIPLRPLVGPVVFLCVYLYTSGGAPTENHLRVGYMYTALVIVCSTAIVLLGGWILIQGSVA
jgi:hypothetical protein